MSSLLELLDFDFFDLNDAESLDTRELLPLGESFESLESMLPLAESEPVSSLLELLERDFFRLLSEVPLLFLVLDELPLLLE